MKRLHKVTTNATLTSRLPAVTTGPDACENIRGATTPGADSPSTL